MSIWLYVSLVILFVVTPTMGQHHTPDELVPESELYNLERPKSKPKAKKKLPPKPSVNRTQTYTVTSPDRFGPKGASSDCRECRPYQTFTQEYQNCYKTYCKR